MNHGNQRPALGDLIRIDGYGTRIFQVDAWRREEYHGIDIEYTEVIYEAFDCGNDEWFEAAAEDVTFVADASQADEWLRANPAPIVPTSDYRFGMDLGGKDFTAFYYNLEGGDEMKAKEPRKPTARELSGQAAERRKQARKERAARIDELLDASNDAKELAVFFGDKDGEYGAKVAEIDRELAELSGEDLR
jgi:hypothetical protein